MTSSLNKPYYSYPNSPMDAWHMVNVAPVHMAWVVEHIAVVKPSVPHERLDMVVVVAHHELPGHGAGEHRGHCHEEGEDKL